ncbi:MAG: TetR/AcrR family transcriptional regulator [Janthinobacterium lividum]
MPSKPPGKPTSKALATRPYHHGALREALLEGAERILDREGINGLTLRAAAREAGASHAAPKNHFDDLTALLSELATVGFRRFHQCLLAATPTTDSPAARLPALGRAYVEFAMQSPGLFLLMFRGERLDFERPGLREAMDAAAAVLQDAVGVTRDQKHAPHLPLTAAAQFVSAWSLVHGFAMLYLDNRLAPTLGRLAGRADALTLLDEILKRY